MINYSSILIVLVIQFIAGLALFLARPNQKDIRQGTAKHPRFWISVFGGAIPLALLGTEMIQRDGLAVLIALVGFLYFIVIKK